MAHFLIQIGIFFYSLVVAASAGLSLNKFALRGYGDFDSCLKIVADDPQRRYDEVFFTGQYCMAQVNLPLPELNRNLTYQDRVLHFNSTEVEGTVGLVECRSICRTLTTCPCVFPPPFHFPVHRVHATECTIHVFKSTLDGTLCTLNLFAIGD